MPTGIEWTDETWNPTTGCSKLSSGCKNCYALRDWARLSKNSATVYYGREFTDVRVHPGRLNLPHTWTRPRRIFVNSMSDLFHEQVPDSFILDVFEVALNCPQHTFQVLTKRAERMRSFFRLHRCPANVQLGVSAEDQLSWEERVPHLLAIQTAGIRFVSLEPLLGMIDGRGRREAKNLDTQVISVPAMLEWPIHMLDWVIVGGESGPQARPSHPKHVRWLRDQCLAAGTPFFFKQWGEWLPEGQARFGVTVRFPAKSHDFGDGFRSWRVGKKIAGRMLDGIQHDAQPLRFPT